MSRAAPMAVALLLAAISCKTASNPAGEDPSDRGEEPSPVRSPGPPADPPRDADIVRLIAGQNAFAVDLYRGLHDQEGNLALSPASIRCALAMTYAGARRQTAVEMKTALHLEVTGTRLHEAYSRWLARLEEAAGEKSSELAIANRLWVDRGLHILADFSKIPASHYHAPVEALDFLADLEGSRNAINAWVEEQTHGRIAGLLEPGAIAEGARLVLTNAVAFAGAWDQPFDPALTSTQVFHAPGGDVEVPMMHQTAMLTANEAEGVRVLELPYAGAELAMVVLLPDSRDGLPALEKALSNEGLQRALEGLSPRQVSLALPRFLVKARFELTQALAAMGMPSAFERGSADFSGMTGNRDLFLSAVIHQAFVEVDEKGTEAAAATAVELAPTGMPNRMQFVVDHPFLFLIRDRETGSLLFLGRVTRP